jgi:ubiquinone/menaquinone biosynthesis C-methylase UbiE
MKESRKFDPRSIEKLNNPERFQRENPDLIWKELALSGPRVLVEIGAGTGFFAAPFARNMRSGTVYACDVQDEMVAWMKEHLPSDIRYRVVPMKMEETKVPLQDAIADLVYMINLHHELEDPVAIVKEAYRLLKPGGTVMVMDWKKEETPAGPPVEIRVSEDEIIRDIEKAGLRNVTTHPVLPYHNFVTAKKS